MKALQRIKKWLTGPTKEEKAAQNAAADIIYLEKELDKWGEVGVMVESQGEVMHETKIKAFYSIDPNAYEKFKEAQEKKSESGHLKIAVLNVLQRAEKQISNYHIRREIYMNKHAYKIENPIREVAIRGAIKELRLAGQPICAGHNGYWLSTNRAEIVEQADKLYYTARGMNEQAQVLYNVAKGYK